MSAVNKHTYPLCEEEQDNVSRVSIFVLKIKGEFLFKFFFSFNGIWVGMWWVTELFNRKKPHFTASLPRCVARRVQPLPGIDGSGLVRVAALYKGDGGGASPNFSAAHCEFAPFADLRQEVFWVDWRRSHILQEPRIFLSAVTKRRKWATATGSQLQGRGQTGSGWQPCAC